MACLTLYLALQLYCLRHSNGTRVAEVYCSPAAKQLLQQWSVACGSQDHQNSSNSKEPSGGAHTHSSASSSSQRRRCCPFVPTPSELAAWQGVQGPLVTFNLRRPDGAWVGYGEVQQLAGAHDILLRTGGRGAVEAGLKDSGVKRVVSSPCKCGHAARLCTLLSVAGT
jgi:hypothetical protein